MVNRNKSALLLSNSVKLKGGKSLHFYSTAFGNENEETVTEVKILNPDHSFEYLDQYKKVDGKKTQMDCKEIQQKILNQMMKDLTDGTLTIKGVNA